MLLKRKNKNKNRNCYWMWPTYASSSFCQQRPAAPWTFALLLNLADSCRCFLSFSFLTAREQKMVALPFLLSFALRDQNPNPPPLSCRRDNHIPHPWRPSCYDEETIFIWYSRGGILILGFEEAYLTEFLTWPIRRPVTDRGWNQILHYSRAENGICELISELFQVGKFRNSVTQMVSVPISNGFLHTHQILVSFWKWHDLNIPPLSRLIPERLQTRSGIQLIPILPDDWFRKACSDGLESDQFAAGMGLLEPPKKHNVSPPHMDWLGMASMDSPPTIPSASISIKSIDLVRKC